MGNQGNAGLFYVNPVWDEDARVYYSDSNIFGLHIEAERISEFDALVQELAPALILENHIMRSESQARELREMGQLRFCHSPDCGRQADVL